MTSSKACLRVADFLPCKRLPYQPAPEGRRGAVTPTIAPATYRAVHLLARHLLAEKVQNHCPDTVNPYRRLPSTLRQTIRVARTHGPSRREGDRRHERPPA